MFSLPTIHSRMMTTEVVIGTLINGLVFPVLLWLAPIPAPLELGGPDGIAASLVKGTVIPVFLMTTILTFLIRKRVAKMALPELDPRTAPLAWLGGLPKLPPLRALIFALVALATVMPVALLVAAGLKTWPLTETTFFLFNVVYGIVIGGVVTPFVVLAVMHEPRTVVGKLSAVH